MDLFEKYINEEEKTLICIRALTDKSFKNYYQRINSKEYPYGINFELATLGDAVIKLCYSDILFDNCDNLTLDKEKYETDEFLVDKVARHYNLLNYMLFDRLDFNKPKDYNYNSTAGTNKNSHKYIATAVEAMIGAIYKETNDLASIRELLKSWMDL